MSQEPFHVLLLGNLSKPYVADAIRDARSWLPELTGGDADLCDLCAEDAPLPLKADLGLVFGGDGAILAAARRVAAAGTPLIGVNLGRLGFMAEVPPQALRECLTDIIQRRPEPVERMMLAGEVVRDGETLARVSAVNDVVLSREARSRLIEMKTFIDGEEVATYAADGLILCTPVGSTAHNLGAGGPILHPGVDAIVVTPICPHTLSNRPIVISADSRIEVEVSSRSVGFALTADGQVFVDLRNGDHVRVKRAQTRLRLIRATRMTFFETLREKLQWGGRPYYGRA